MFSVDDTFLKSIRVPFIAITMILQLIDDEKSKDDWIGSVGRSIVRCSSTYVSRGGQNQGGANKGSNDNAINEEEEDSDDYSNSSNNPYFND